MNTKKLSLKELGYPNYKSYLASSHWSKKKQTFKKSSKSTKINGKPSCVCCKSTSDIHVHHKTYYRLGKEKLGDLIYLCKDCHESTHLLQKHGYALKTAHLKIKIPDSEPRKKEVKPKRKKKCLQDTYSKYTHERYLQWKPHRK